jgi:PTH1 family peptidyl-tRNA hydrolase
MRRHIANAVVARCSAALLQAHVGEAFWRLRIGVGHPAVKGEVVDYVLARAPIEEDKLIREGVSAAADIVPIIIEQGGQKAMHRLHSRGRPSPPPAKQG